MFARLSAFWFFLRRFVQRLRGVGLGRTAASLSFTTLLGLVPLFTVAFTYVARFPLFERWLDALESFLLKFLLPASGTNVRHYLAEFIAKAGTLKGISIAFVIVTALLLVTQVEREINAIWGIQEPRALPRRVVIYVLGFTAVPVLIGAAVYFTSWLIDISMAAVPSASGAVSALARPIAVGIAAMVLTLLYMLVAGAASALAARVDRRLRGGDRIRVCKIRVRVLHYARADLPDYLRRSRSAPAISDLDVLVVDHRAGRRGVDGDAHRAGTAHGAETVGARQAPQIVFTKRRRGAEMKP